MKNCERHFLIALVVLFLGQFLAPNAAKSQVIEVGGSVGLSYYMGDLNPSKPFNQNQLGFGAVVRYYDNSRWAFRLAYSNLKLVGNDVKANCRPDRGLSFNTTVNDVAVVAEFNFFEYFTGSKRSYISPYIFGGLSLVSFNPKADDGTELCNVLTDVDYEVAKTNGDVKYSKMSASIPFGVGVKYSISDHIGMTVEWRMDYAFTDWLDDCHAYYPTYNGGEPYVQYSDPTGLTDPNNTGVNTQKYIQRGNPENNDWFGYLNVSVAYKFILPKNKDCNVGADKKYYKYY